MEKRNKTKTVRVRVSDEIYEAFSKYVKDKNVTKTKVVVDDYLVVLLKDYLTESK